MGNILVVIAIFTERNLTGVQNWFIASLAVADLCIGSVIMPFSLAYTLLGKRAAPRVLVLQVLTNLPAYCEEPPGLSNMSHKNDV